jgi:hypothetical protein
MDTSAFIGATVTGAAGYFGAKMDTGLSEVSCLGVGIGLALFTGGFLHFAMLKDKGDPNY